MVQRRPAPLPPTNGYGWTVSSGSSGPPCGLWWWYGSSGHPPCGLWWWYGSSGPRYVGMLVCWYACNKYIYIDINIHTYIHACMHTCMHTYMHTYIHTSYIHTYIHTFHHHHRGIITPPILWGGVGTRDTGPYMCSEMGPRQIHLLLTSLKLHDLSSRLRPVHPLLVHD